MRRTFFARFLLLLALLIPGHPVDAAWMKNVPQTLEQPDGSTLNCFATGDEYYNWLHDGNQYTIIQDPETGWYLYAKKENGKLVATLLIPGIDDPAQAGLTPNINITPEQVIQLRNARFQTPEVKSGLKSAAIGIMNNIVVFIRFNDQTEYTTPITSYNTAFNGAGQVSVLDYYQNVSNSQLTINSTFYPTPSGTTIVSYQDAHPRDYYRPFNASSNTIGYNNDSESTDREHTLLANAIAATKTTLEATGLNYDFDNDGRVDNISFIIKGSSDGWNDLLWPHRWALYTQDVRIGTLQVYGYILMPSNSFSISTTCHEMSHAIGAPDLYHYSQDGLTPVGSWDLMQYNQSPPQQMGAYIKYKYFGWYASLPEITSSGTYSLSPLSTNPFACYKIASPNSASQYFLVEYRKKEGRYEISLPGSGLIIYRINPSIEGNSQGPPDEVYAYRPGGTPSNDGTISQANYSSETGRVAISSSTNPTPFLQDGSPGGLNISGIGSAGSTIDFTVNFSAPEPDLIISSPATTPTSANPGGTFNMSCTYTNQGSGIAGTSMLRLYLSVDQTKDGADVELANGNISTVNPGASYNVTATGVTIPGNTTSGTYYILFVADADQDVSESNETNNVSYSTFTVISSSVFNPPRNLTVNASGTTAALSWDEPNSGSSGTLSGYKIFRDGSLINTSTNPSQRTYSDTGLAYNSYTYYVTATYTSQTGESAASNQVSVTISPPAEPDLIITNPTVTPSSLLAGETIDITCQLVNQGTATAGSSTLKIFLSANQTFEVSDSELASGAMQSINAGSYLEVTGDGITIPLATAPGNYYVLFIADAEDQVSESDENNNVSYTSLSITAPPVFNPPRNLTASVTYNQVDLAWNSPAFGSSGTLSGFNIFRDRSLISTLSSSTILSYQDSGLSLGSYTYYVTAIYTSASGESAASNQVAASVTVIPEPDLEIINTTVNPTSIYPGESFDLSFRIQNQGIASASESTTGIFLSSNSSYELGDTPLTTQAIPALNAGNYLDITLSSISVSGSLTPGNYYVLLIADTESSVTESDETNNLTYGTIEVKDPSIFNPPRNLMAAINENSVTLTWETPLTGSSGTLSGFNLFRDGTLISSSVTPTILSFTESGLTLGTYTYWVTATYLTFSGESSASNSVQVNITVIPQPDLLITNQTVTPVAVDPGESIELSWRLLNQGTAPAGSSVFRVYLSDNPTFEPVDYLLTYGNMAEIDAGYYLDVPGFPITMSASSSPGNYFLLFIADADSDVQERDESNNLAYAPLEVNDLSGINDPIFESHLHLFPSPAQNELKLSYTGPYMGKCRIRIINLLGKVVSSDAFTLRDGFEYTWDVGKWTNGIYFVQMIAGKEMKTRMIIVAH